MDNKQSKIVKSAAEFLMVYSAQCRCCNNAFDYAAETADTDMVSCFCSSVYSSKKKQLVYSRQIRSAVSIAPAAAAKRHISLCGCMHQFILVVSLFDRQCIIAPLTAKEFYNGQAGYFDKRINAIAHTTLIHS